MIFLHGALENEIMNALWYMEENNIKNITVNKVLQNVNNNGNIRAYTTIKTVMDRLVEKEFLLREKIGKKFCYKSIKSRSKMAQSAIEKLVHQYFNDDIKLLISTLENQCLSLKA